MGIHTGQSGVHDRSAVVGRCLVGEKPCTKDKTSMEMSTVCIVMEATGIKIMTTRARPMDATLKLAMELNSTDQSTGQLTKEATIPTMKIDMANATTTTRTLSSGMQQWSRTQELSELL